MEAVYPYFSSSSNGAPRLLEAIILQARDGSALRSRMSESNDVPNSARDVIETLSTSDSISLWHPSVGRLLNKADDIDPVATRIRFVEVALYASISGIPGNWTVEFSHGLTIRCGAALLRDVRGLGVYPMGETITIEVDYEGGSLETVHFSSGQPRQSSNAGRWAYLELPLGGHPLVLSHDVERVAELLPDYAGVELLMTSQAESEHATIAGLDLLKGSCAPQYDWVSSVIAQIGFLSALKGQLSSSSNPTIYGLVAISAFDEPVAIAEMLVHEASHQHFFIAKRLGPMHDGTDQTLHFSPMAGRSRPLEPLLLAYHALGNMALMHANLANLPGPTGAYSAQRLNEILIQAADLAPAFRGNHALTALGQGIFEPLDSQISALA